MDYIVVGTDGKDYGPIAEEVLKIWASEDRVRPESTVKEFLTGRTFLARDVPGLFATVNNSANPYTTPPAAYVAPVYAPTVSKDAESTGPLWGVVLRCAAALVLFFVLHGLGIVFSAYAMYYAIQAKNEGNKYGVICIVIASVTLLVVGAGWILRIASGDFS